MAVHEHSTWVDAFSDELNDSREMSEQGAGWNIRNFDNFVSKLSREYRLNTLRNSQNVGYIVLLKLL